MDKDEALKLAMRKAFNLGATYWQQADSEYSREWKKADETKARLDQLVEETIAAIRAGGGNMTIPPDLQDRLIEVLRLAHDNAMEAHQDAQERYRGYKQHRIDALRAEAVETETVLFEVLKARGNT